MFLFTMLPAIFSKTAVFHAKIVVFHAKIVPCDETKYYVQNERTSYDTQLSDALNPEE